MRFLLPLIFILASCNEPPRQFEQFYDSSTDEDDPRMMSCQCDDGSYLFKPMPPEPSPLPSPDEGYNDSH